MSTPTGASGKFTSVYSDAARILSLMPTSTQPKHKQRCTIGLTNEKGTLPCLFSTRTRTFLVALVLITAIASIASIASLRTITTLGTIATFTPIGLLNAILTLPATVVTSTAYRLLHPAAIAADCGSRSTTDGTADDRTLLPAPVIANRRAGAATYRTAQGTPHLRVIDARRQQQHGH
jgi:hypothetical protein